MVAEAVEAEAVKPVGTETVDAEAGKSEAVEPARRETGKMAGAYAGRASGAAMWAKEGASPREKKSVAAAHARPTLVKREIRMGMFSGAATAILARLRRRS